MRLRTPQFLGCGFAVEEEDVGLHTLRVEDTRREAEQRMNIGLFEQLAADGLPSRSPCEAFDNATSRSNRSFTEPAQMQKPCPIALAFFFSLALCQLILSAHME